MCGSWPATGMKFTCVTVLGEPQAMPIHALLADVWERVHQAELSVMGTVTLQELAERQEQLDQKRTLMYHI